MDDTWTIFTSSGEYSETGLTAMAALTRFEALHPDDFVTGIKLDVDYDEAGPPLVPFIP